MSVSVSVKGVFSHSVVLYLAVIMTGSRVDLRWVSI